MEDILEDETGSSSCCHMAVQDSRLHVSDPGLGRVYTLYQEGGEGQAMVCGGPEQWLGPEGVAGDGLGGLLVVDSGNHRVVQLDEDGGVVGLLGLDGQVVRPGVMAVDSEARSAIWWGPGKYLQGGSFNWSNPKFSKYYRHLEKFLASLNGILYLDQLKEPPCRY